MNRSTLSGVSMKISWPSTDCQLRLSVDQVMNKMLSTHQDVSPSMSNTPKLSRFVWGTLRFDVICTASIVLPEVKIREIMIYEPSLFLERVNNLQSIRMRHFTTRHDSHRVPVPANQLPAWWIDNRGNDSYRFHRINNIFNPLCTVHRNSILGNPGATSWDDAIFPGKSLL